jgi:VWFA-related protein
MRSRLLLALGTALLAAVPGRAQAPGPPSSFPAGVELVTVDVVAIGAGDQPVLDLTRGDFTVKEDGVVQEIVTFEAVHHLVPAPDAARPAGRPPLEPRTSTNQGPVARAGSHFLIVFDELHLDSAEAARGRAAVARFLDAGVGEGDGVALVGTAEGTRWTARMPEGRADLVRALDGLRGRRDREEVRSAMTEYEAMRIDRDRDPIITDRVMRRLLATGEIRHDVSVPGEPVDTREEIEGWRAHTLALAAPIYARASARSEQTLGIVERTLRALGEARGRKSLVLVSAGLVQDPRLDGYKRVVTQARRANTAVTFLDARGLVAAESGLQAEVSQPADLQDRSTGAGIDETREGSEGSEGLALDTGGFVLRNANDLGAGLARIGREARSYYLIGYAPTNRTADGRFRRIEVQVARPGVALRARRGYFAPDARGSAGTSSEKRDEAMQRALDAPFDLSGVGLRALAQVFGEAAPGQTRVLITVEADVRPLAFAEEGGAARDTLDTLLIVAHRGSGDFTRFDQQFDMAFRPQTRAAYERTWFPMTRELKLPPGPYQAKVVVRDRNSGRVGTVGHEFDVPAPAGLRLSSLVLSDRLREGGGPDERTPEPIARRQFDPAGLLHCRFEVYGAALDPATGQPNVIAGFALRRSDGQVLAAMPQTPLRPGPDGSLARALGVPLDGAPAGRYEVIVLVTDVAAGRTAERREPIVIGEPPPEG